MSRELLLLRHAKSAWDTGVVDDFDRPLAKRGLKDAPRMGAWMLQQGIHPDYIVSSPAQRAKQTIFLVCDSDGIPQEKIHWDKRVYMADVSTLLAVLADSPRADKRVLLVGHNPGLDELLVYLCGKDLPRTASGKLMTTAGLARIELPDDWNGLSSHCGTLLNLVRPKELET